MRTLLLLLLGTSVGLAQFPADGGFFGSTIPSVTSLTAPTFIRANTNSAASGVVAITNFSATGGNFELVKISMRTAVSRTIHDVTNASGQVFTNIYTTNLFSTTQGKIAVYGLVNPVTGDINVALSGTYTALDVDAELYNNVGGVGVPFSFALSSQNGSFTNSVTTITTDLVSDWLGYGATIETPTVGLGQTLITNAYITSVVGGGTSSFKPGVASSTSMYWTTASADTVSWIIVPLNGL